MPWRYLFIKQKFGNGEKGFLVFHNRAVLKQLSRRNFFLHFYLSSSLRSGIGEKYLLFRFDLLQDIRINQCDSARSSLRKMKSWKLFPFNSICFLGKEQQKVVTKIVKNIFYLQHENLAGRSIDVEFTVGWVVRIDALTRQEINDILRSVFVTVSSSHLYFVCEMANKFDIRKCFLPHGAFGETKNNLQIKTSCNDIVFRRGKIKSHAELN